MCVFGETRPGCSLQGVCYLIASVLHFPPCVILSSICYPIIRCVILSPDVLSYHPVCYLITRLLSYHPACYPITRCVILSPGVLSYHPVRYIITRVLSCVLHERYPGIPNTDGLRPRCRRSWSLTIIDPQFYGNYPKI